MWTRSALAALTLALGALTAPASAASVWYVRAGAPAGGDGTSWATAFDDLQPALEAFQVGDQVWVAAGTYRPSALGVTGDPRSARFFLTETMQLFGGFAGHETSIEERVGLFDQTVLNADLGVLGDRSDNAYHVIRAYHPAGAPQGGVVIDGFTLSGGNADGFSHDAVGGAIYASNLGVTLTNATVVGNRAKRGGGVFVQPAGLALIHCRFLENEAIHHGGALFGQLTLIRAYNSVFARNSAGLRGGAVVLQSMAAANSGLFANCVFHDNVSQRGGVVYLDGGKFVEGGKARFTGCTMAYNRATLEGGALWVDGSDKLPARCKVQNSILWGNDAPAGPQLSGRAEITYSDVEGGYAPLAGNLAVPPGFVDPASRNLRLATGSPLVDAGNLLLMAPDLLDLDHDGFLNEPVPTDADGGRRRVDDPDTPDTGVGSPPVVDLGAYEWSGPPALGDRRSP